MRRESTQLLTILTVTAVIVFCLQVFSDNKADVDLWGNVGFVKALPWSGDFHYVNTFSFTQPEHPWVNHEWLAEYVFYRVYSTFGNTGLLALKIMLGLTVVALIYVASRQTLRSGALQALFLLLLVSTMGYGFSTRPHLFTYVFLAALLLLLRQHHARPLMLPAIMPILGILWANFHGAFFIGAIVLALYATTSLVMTAVKGSLRRNLRPVMLTFAALALFLAATLVNPYGPHLWEFVFQSGATMRPYLSEWAMFNPIRDFGTHPDFVVLVIITVCVLVFSRRHSDPCGIVILSATLASAFFMRRNIPLFAIVAGSVLPAFLEDAAGVRFSRIITLVRPALLNIVLLALIPFSLYSCTAFNKSSPLQIEIPAGKYPLEIIRFMQRNAVSGNALVFFDWAELAIWKLYPQCRVFLDGRFLSAYSEDTIRDYFQFLYGAPEWDRAIDAYPTDIVLVHAGNPVVPLIARRPDWRLAFAAGPARLYLKYGKHTQITAMDEVDAALLPAPECKPVELFP